MDIRMYFIYGKGKARRGPGGALPLEPPPESPRGLFKDPQRVLGGFLTLYICFLFSLNVFNLDFWVLGAPQNRGPF